MPQRLGWMECEVLGGNGQSLKVTIAPSDSCASKRFSCLASCSHEGNLLLANAIIQAEE